MMPSHIGVKSWRQPYDRGPATANEQAKFRRHIAPDYILRT